MRDRLITLIDSPHFQTLVTVAILVNAVGLGLETAPTAMAAAGGLIRAIDLACLAFFVVEIGLRIAARGWGFFRSGWGWFDLIIVGAALLPGAQGVTALRALRILRLMRLISVTPRLRRVVEGLFDALPGMASVFGLMALIFYIGAVIATKLFAADFPDWFGTIGRSLYTLFQIMTLESWSMGIARPVLAVYPLAWLFFVPFILLTTFTVANLVVGLIVNSMQDAHHEEDNQDTADYRHDVAERLARIEETLARLEAREPPRD